MADINVERRGPSVWPWVIGLLVLALLIWALVEIFGEESEPMIADPTADTVDVNIGTPSAPAPPPIIADTSSGLEPAGAAMDTAPGGVAP